MRRTSAWPALVAVSSLAAACSRDVSLPEVNPLVASPSFASVAPRERIELGATGGAGPYRFAFGTAGAMSGPDATVDPDTGAYQAGRLGSAQDDVVVTDSAGRSAHVTIAVGPRLVIAPGLNSVSPGATVQFSASGGKPPYMFAAGSHGGAPQVDPVTGLYRAGPEGDVEDDVQVSDATLDPAAVTTARVLVGRALSLLRVDTGALAPEDVTQLVVLGGDPDYVFTIVASGNGSGGTMLAGGAYRAGPVGNTTDTVEVIDQLGQTATLVIPIGPALALDLGATEVHPGATVKLSASGGRPPYRFGFLPRGNRSHGTVDPNTGDYTPGANAGAVDLLVVGDATNRAQASPAIPPRVGGVRLPATGPTYQCVTADLTGDHRDDALLFQGTTIQLWSQPATGPSVTIDHTYGYAYGPAIAGPLDGNANPAQVAMMSGQLTYLAPDLTGTLHLVSPTVPVVGQVYSLSSSSRATSGTSWVPSIFTTASCAGGFLAVDWASVAAGPGPGTQCVTVPGAAAGTLALVAADFNGDGWTDLAWIPAGATSVLVSLAIPSSTAFAAPKVVGLPVGYRFVQDGLGPFANFAAVGSMSGSSWKDLALRVIDSAGRGALALVKVSNGTPALAPGSPFDPLPGSAAGAAGFREVRSSQSYVAWDGLTAAVAGVTFDASGNPSVSTQLLASTPAFPVGCIASGDFDGDGLWDLLVASATGAVAEVRYGDGRGFGVRPRFAAPGPFAVADVDGDGLDDVVTATATPGIAVLLGSDHQLAFQTEIAIPRAAVALAVGRLWGGSLGVLWQDALGAFWTASIAAGGQLGAPATLDVRDGGVVFSTQLTALRAAANLLGPADDFWASAGQGAPLHLIRVTGAGTALHAVTLPSPSASCWVAPLGTAGAGTAVAACATYSTLPNLYQATFNAGSFGGWTGPISASGSTVLGVTSYIGHLATGEAVFLTANGASPGVLTATLGGGGLAGTDVTVAGTSDGPQSAVLADVNGDGIPDVVSQTMLGGAQVLLGDAGGNYTFHSKTPGSGRVASPAKLAPGTASDVLAVPVGGAAGTIIPLVADGSGGLH